jgi:hypothetical protein
MSIHQPFPPHGKADPVDVFLFFWLPVLCVALPALAAVVTWLYANIQPWFVMTFGQ